MCLMPHLMPLRRSAGCFGADEAGATAHSPPVIGRHWGGVRLMSQRGWAHRQGTGERWKPAQVGTYSGAVIGFQALAPLQPFWSFLRLPPPALQLPLSIVNLAYDTPDLTLPSRQTTTTASPESIRLSPSAQQLAMRASD